MKFPRDILLGVALILGALVLTRNIIVRVALEQGAWVMTGLKLNIEKIDVGFWRPTLNIKNLVLFNPPGYADRVMVDVGEIDLRYKRTDMLRGQIYLNDLHLTLKDLFIIRRPGNQFNFDALGKFQSSPNKTPQALTIDDFTLNVGKVIYKDYSHLPTPLVKTYDLNLNEHYKDIHGTDNLEHLVMAGVLDKTSIASAIKVDLSKIKDGVSGTILNGLQASDSSIKGLLNSL